MPWLGVVLGPPFPDGGACAAFAPVVPLEAEFGDEPDVVEIADGDEGAAASLAFLPLSSRVGVTPPVLPFSVVALLFAVPSAAGPPPAVALSARGTGGVTVAVAVARESDGALAVSFVTLLRLVDDVLVPLGAGFAVPDVPAWDSPAVASAPFVLSVAEPAADASLVEGGFDRSAGCALAVVLSAVLGAASSAAVSGRKMLPCGGCVVVPGPFSAVDEPGDGTAEGDSAAVALEPEAE